jgi:tight adherence protein B
VTAGSAILAAATAGSAVLALTAARGAVRAVRRRRVLLRLRPLALSPAPSPAGPGAPRWLAERLAAAGVDTPPSRAWHAWLGAGGAVTAGGLLVGGPATALMGAAVAGATPLAVLVAFRDRADRRLEAALPEALESVARSLRAGASMPGAVARAGERVPGPLGRDLLGVAATVEAGERLEGALDRWAARRPLPGVRLAVTALALAAGTGGAPARAVDGVAATLRARVAVAGEVRALSSQARASALVIALAPLAFMVLAAASDTRTAAFLFRSPAGLACLAAGIALDGVGALWMHRLAAIDPW